jgi:hypothetical protein
MRDEGVGMRDEGVGWAERSESHQRVGIGRLASGVRRQASQTHPAHASAKAASTSSGEGVRRTPGARYLAIKSSPLDWSGKPRMWPNSCSSTVTRSKPLAGKVAGIGYPRAGGRDVGSTDSLGMLSREADLFPDGFPTFFRSMYSLGCFFRNCDVSPRGPTGGRCVSIAKVFARLLCVARTSHPCLGSFCRPCIAACLAAASTTVKTTTGPYAAVRNLTDACCQQ